MKYGGKTQKPHEKKVFFSCLEGYNGLWIIPFPPFLKGNLPKNNLPAFSFVAHILTEMFGKTGNQWQIYD